MSSKFNKELQILVRDKVISPELAEKIEQYYATRDLGKPNKLFTIFGIFGALLVGSGIILMLAHNWDHFSKMTKTVLAFLPLVIGQALAGFSIFKEKTKTWKEASGTFLFFAVGACIAMVSQIYNIEGELGTYLLTWIVLCLPLIYVLRSNAVALLILITSAYYALVAGVFVYRSKDIPWFYVPIFLAVIPHYVGVLKHKITSNSTTILNWVVPASLAIGFISFIGSHDTLGFVMYILLFGLFYNIGKLSVFKDLRTLKNGFLMIGSLGTVIILMIFSFKWIWQDVSVLSEYKTQDMLMVSVLFVLAAMVLGYMISKKGIKSINLFQISFVLFCGVYFLTSTVTVLPIVLINVLVFALGISAIRIGAKKFNFGILNYGLLIISVLIAFRFFDTGMSFVIRGILFVLVGSGFFLTNYFMFKKQQKIKQQLKDIQL